MFEHTGKNYNGERAIISLTSWKRRIHTAGFTIFSLLHACPGFHIVLVLSTDEFPNKEADLPTDLVKMMRGGLFEILWIKQNFRCFKKLLPTQSAYQSIPIILADDGIVYKMNYAERLYNEWASDPGSIYASDLYTGYGIAWGVGGAGIIFPPACFAEFYPKCLSDRIIQCNHDDALYGILASKKHIPFKRSKTVVWQQIYTDTEEGNRTSMHALKMYSDTMIPSMIKEVNSIC